MNRLSLACAALLLFASPALADRDAVTLTPSAPLAAGLAAFPRLAGTDKVAVRINAALAKADARAKAGLAECKAMAGKDAEWSRTISVPMRGPRFLALVAQTSWNCGGAHPGADSIALVYDLGSGAPVYWGRYLPKTLIDSTATDTAGDGTTLGQIVSAKLKPLYIAGALAAGADPQCKDALEDGAKAFQIWPDARRQGLAMQPSVPHVIAACADPVVIPLAKLKALGAKPALTDAIAEAHARGWYDRTP